MSFFDDEPTRVTPPRRRPATPRQPAAPATGGAHRPPNRQAARTRQAMAIGIGIVVLLIVILGARSCANSRTERAMKDYARDAGAIITDSNDQVTKPFFDLLSSGATSGNDLQVQVNQVRIAAEEDSKRASNLSVPGSMTAAQRNLLLTLNLRAQALTRIAEKLPTAQGRGQQAEQAVQEIAGQMQMFLASDVIWSQRGAPLIAQTLNDKGINGQTIPESRSLPAYTWLAPATIAKVLGSTSGGSGSTTAGTCPAGTACGHGLLSTTIGDVTLQPDGASNRVPATAPLTITVKFQNQGDNIQTKVVVTVKLTTPGQAAITAKKTVNETQPGAESEVAIPLPKVPASGSAGQLTVSIARVPGEENTDNNSAQYTILFAG
ncbi:unannotated protein [freshwater metagenome]|uniref:Unannotated protein n=1 Tax=freshwater metagenome TaxID=449393 RepID=A0A6J7HBR5_9ZZZZ